MESGLPLHAHRQIWGYVGVHGMEDWDCPARLAHYPSLHSPQQPSKADHSEAVYSVGRSSSLHPHQQRQHLDATSTPSSGYFAQDLRHPVQAVNAPAGSKALTRSQVYPYQPIPRPLVFVNTVLPPTPSSPKPVECEEPSPPPARPKRKRVTPDQLAILVSLFEDTENPSFEAREKLAERINMTNREVQVWFQNRRAKMSRLRGKAAAAAAPSPPSCSAAVAQAAADSIKKLATTMPAAVQQPPLMSSSQDIRQSATNTSSLEVGHSEVSVVSESSILSTKSTSSGTRERQALVAMQQSTRWDRRKTGPLGDIRRRSSEPGRERPAKMEAIRMPDRRRLSLASRSPSHSTPSPPPSTGHVCSSPSCRSSSFFSLDGAGNSHLEGLFKPCTAPSMLSPPATLSCSSYFPPGAKARSGPWSDALLRPRNESSSSIRLPPIMAQSQCESFTGAATTPGGPKRFPSNGRIQDMRLPPLRVLLDSL